MMTLSWKMHNTVGQFADFASMAAATELTSLLPTQAAQLRVFFPKWLLAGFPRLCAALYADTLLTRFLSAFAFLFSLLLF
jgi:hypothetical protein